MAITRDQVQHVARLADLSLTPDEVDRLTVDLGVILGHIEQLNELDTSSVPPTAHVAVSQMRLREDAAHPGLDRNDALQAGPSVSGGAFAVPKFVDEG
jgi:aspartyl-tRNA(Asn)/glutamyl-tRNA(Gln) amidotransferase subunit C